MVSIPQTTLQYEDNGVIKNLIVPPGEYNVKSLEKWINFQIPFSSNKIKIKKHKKYDLFIIKSPYRLFLTEDNPIANILGFNEVIELSCM